MKKTILVASILVSLALLGGVVWAMQLNRSSALRWDDPDWERAYIEMLFWGDDPPQVDAFVFSGTVRLVDGDGAVLDSQVVEAPQCEPQEEPGDGQCGSAYTWSWETDDYPRKTITEEVKLTWIAPAYDPGIELVIPFVPSTCDLAGKGCTLGFDQDTWTVSIPMTCENALAACGTWQDADGWWFVSSFEGTEPWTRCLPGIAVGGPQ